MELALIAMIVGVVAGWLATVLVKGWGFGLIGNLIVGILGAELTAFGFRYFGLYSFPLPDSLGNSFGAVTQATIGAIVFLLVVGITRKRTA
jgi:uncharacterized membrane protein YeaQ/YmgE (transglycosylase-associated protein family)